MRVDCKRGGGLIGGVDPHTGRTPRRREVCKFGGAGVRGKSPAETPRGGSERGGTLDGKPDGLPLLTVYGFATASEIVTKYGEHCTERARRGYN